MSALNDRYSARVEGGHMKSTMRTMLSQAELIVLNSFVDPKMEGGQYKPDYWVGETALYQHPQFRALRTDSSILEKSQAWGILHRFGYFDVKNSWASISLVVIGCDFDYILLQTQPLLGLVFQH